MVELTGVEPLPPDRPFSALSAFFSLMGAGPSASKEGGNYLKIDADRCFAVLTELIFAQARQSPQRILTYFQGF